MDDSGLFRSSPLSFFPLRGLKVLASNVLALVLHLRRALTGATLGDLVLSNLQRPLCFRDIIFGALHLDCGVVLLGQCPLDCRRQDGDLLLFLRLSASALQAARDMLPVRPLIASECQWISPLCGSRCFRTPFDRKLHSAERAPSDILSENTTAMRKAEPTQLWRTRSQPHLSPPRRLPW